MSIRIMSVVWDTPLADSEKLVLLALADWSNDDGQCWPSIAQLTKKTSKSERTIQASLKKLEAAGHITRDQKPGRGCHYVVHPRSGCTPAAAAPRSRSTPAKSAPPQPLPPTPAAAAPNTSRTTNSSDADASSEARVPGKAGKLEIPEWMPAEPWVAFVEMRRAMPKIPFTIRAAKAIVEELDGFRVAGHDVAAILMRSVKNGYRGVFAPDAPPKAAAVPQPALSPADEAELKRIRRAYENDEMDFDDFMSRKAKLFGEERRRARPAPIGSLAVARRGAGTTQADEQERAGA